MRYHGLQYRQKSSARTYSAIYFFGGWRNSRQDTFVLGRCGRVSPLVRQLELPNAVRSLCKQHEHASTISHISCWHVSNGKSATWSITDPRLSLRTRHVPAESIAELGR